VLLRGFGCERHLKTYVQSNQPKVSLKGSYFKMLNSQGTPDEVLPRGETVGSTSRDNAVVSTSGDNHIDSRSVEMTENP